MYEISTSSFQMWNYKYISIRGVNFNALTHVINKKNLTR